MKKLLLVILVLSYTYAKANKYYFSTNSGNDSRTSTEAQNPLTPWKTPAKLNSFFNSLEPGDSVLFKSGETFSGSIIPSKSGTALLPIIIGSYGSGTKPIITGFTSITNWTPLSGGIYEYTTCSTCSNVNIALFQDTLQPMGRWPKLSSANGGYLVFQSHTGFSSITSNAIASASQYIGGEVVIRKYGWIIDRGSITSQTSTVVSYSPFTAPEHPTFTYEPRNGFGFFFQNHINTLTQLGEWMYESSTRKFRMFFGSNNPASYSVQVPNVENLVFINGVSNVTFSNLSFRGANSNAFYINKSSAIQVLNCDLDYSGVDAINASADSKYITLKNSTITNTNNNAITAHGSPNWTIQNNVISKTGLIRGMGLSGDWQYNGISHVGSNTIIEHNVVKKTGYNAMDFSGDSTLIKNNFIDSFCLVKSDGGGIYTSAETSRKDRKIIGNIVLNGLGDRNGRSSDEMNNPYAGNVHGIYMDGGATDVIIDSNTSANCSSSGLELSSPNDVQVKHNTLFNNTYSQIFYFESTRPIVNLTLKHNILFAKPSDQLISLISSGSDHVNTWGDIDSNYYCRPISEPSGVDTPGYSHSPTFFDYPDGGIIQGANNRFYSLDKWQVKTSQDAHTKKTPVTITDLNDILFEYNPTNTVKTIPLSGSYLDVVGQFYNNTLTLAPYSSVILIKKPIGSLLNQSINFAPLPSKTFGDVPFTLSATASSGLPVTFRIVSGPATLAGNLITLTGSGTVVIEAAQPGNSIYNPAPVVNQSLIVVKANQVITFPAPPAKTLGDVPFPLTATSSSGLAVTLKIVSGPATLSGNLVTLTAAGTVSIEASQPGDANYNAAQPVVRSFIVNAAGPGTGGCSATGNILREQWDNIFGTDIADIPLQIAPGSTGLISNLETQNTGNWMGARIRGYICPPATGNYVFYISGDDAVELWLSPNNNPAARVKIAESTGWTAFRQFDKYPSQKSSPISLQSGESYYIEVLHKNGGGGDNVSVKWQLPNGTMEVPVPGSRLSPYLAGGTKINQVIDFGPLSTRTFGDIPFSLNATASSGLPVSFRLISGPATLSGNTVALTGPGTVIVEASQPGNTNYQPATPVVQSFIVNPAGGATSVCSATGSIRREQWDNIFGTNVSDIPVQTNPSSSSLLFALETRNTGNWMGARIRGYICPPLSGNYTFYISGDDAVELWLSTSDNPANKVQIANNSGTWTAFREWDKYPSQKSAPINLQSGKGYYIEALHKNGGGGDNVSVRWDLPNGITEAPIPGTHLSPYSSPVVPGGFVSGNSLLEISGDAVRNNEGTTLNAYPNPFRNSVTIRINPAVSGQTTLDVYDVHGKLVKNIFKGVAEIGVPRSFVLNSVSMSDEIYIIRLVTKTGIVNQKLMLVK